MNKQLQQSIALSCLLTSSLVWADRPKSIDDLYELIQQQQREISQLKRQLNETDEKVEATGEAVEQVASEGSTSTSSSWASRTKIGGYGELHYNNFDQGGSEIDFHRFVLFFSHQFNENTRFVSEFELEHVLSGDGKKGEVELEQAYVELDLTEDTHMKAGLFLMPVGLLNETHEPPTFYGVERNNVEKNIIPTTWWEAGIGVSGHHDSGLSYDVAVTSGLDVPQDGSNAFKIRNGRTKVSEARAEAGAVTGRVKWTGMPGIELGLALQYQDDVTQGDLDVSATLLETHAVINKGGFGLRALYARWDLDGAEPEAIGRDEQTGWYIEPSYKINPKFGLFARYAEYDNNAGNSAATEIEETTAGFNFWPHEDVVFKFDYVNFDGAKDDDGFNLGVGYQF